MNSDELRAKGYVDGPGGWYKPKRGADRPGTRPCATTEKLEGDLPKPRNRKTVHRDKAGNEGMDATGHPKFAISIELLVSDNIRRDADGCLSTLLDCLVAALRGFRR